MNNYDFDKCREFLEDMISKHPENVELIKAYCKLIEKKTDFDISSFQGNDELRKDWEKNQTERIKTEADIIKKEIEHKR
ncbi:MAG: hypothetical protein QX189_08315 [Methylococcales bacterium]